MTTVKALPTGHERAFKSSCCHIYSYLLTPLPPTSTQRSTQLTTPHSSTMSMSPQPSPFLRLPAELRVMVHEEISATVHQHVLAGPGASGAPALAILVRKGLPTALLPTCRLINDETMPIFRKKYLETASKPVRFVVDKYTAKPLVSKASPLNERFGLTLEVAMPEAQELPSVPLDLPHEIQEACLVGVDSTYDVHTHYEDVPSFVLRAKTTITNIVATSPTPTRGFDIEIRLRGEIGYWSANIMKYFLYNAYAMHSRTGLETVVYGRNLAHGAPYIYSILGICADSWWFWWRNSSEKLPGFSLVDVP